MPVIIILHISIPLSFHCTFFCIVMYQTTCISYRTSTGCNGIAFSVEVVMLSFINARVLPTKSNDCLFASKVRSPTIKLQVIASRRAQEREKEEKHRDIKPTPGLAPHLANWSLPFSFISAFLSLLLPAKLLVSRCARTFIIPYVATRAR